MCAEGFYIEHGDTEAEEESIDRLWLVVRSLKNPEGKFDYKIKKFDAIRGFEFCHNFLNSI